MLRHLGYVAIALSIDATTNRTCRLRNATPETLRRLIRSNLEGLRKVLQFNRRHGIYLYRISSQIIPFASHPVNRIAWWDEQADLFAELGELIAANGFRVSMHPGQFTVLNSPRREVVEASLLELQWHVRFLDSLDTDSGNKIVLHVGSAHGGKAEAADRFVAIEAGFLAAFAVSDNTRGVFDLKETRERLGFSPQDNAEAYR